MKKVVMLTTVAVLAMSGIAVSQAEETTTDTVATASQPAVAAGVADEAMATDTMAVETADATTTPTTKAQTDAEPKAQIPQDTPQVQKLIALYPKLVARIQPYGKVCFEGEDCDVTVTAAGAGNADGSPRDGKTVYNAVCHTCHTGGLLGSPKLGDAGDWGARIAQGNDTLYKHAIEGFNAMPAKGGADIPDEEVQNAVDYMIKSVS